MTAPSGPLAGKQVLVVEDHEDAREIAHTMLTHAGATVVAAASPEDALPTLVAMAFDVILTDLGFDGDPMAGRQVLAVARRVSTGCKVIAVTGRKEAEDELNRLGFDRVLVKPVDPFELVAAVVRVVAPD